MVSIHSGNLAINLAFVIISLITLIKYQNRTASMKGIMMDWAKIKTTTVVISTSKT